MVSVTVKMARVAELKCDEGGGSEVVSDIELSLWECLADLAEDGQAAADVGVGVWGFNVGDSGWEVSTPGPDGAAMYYRIPSAIGAPLGASVKLGTSIVCSDPGVAVHWFLALLVSERHEGITFERQSDLGTLIVRFAGAQQQQVVQFLFTNP